MAKDGTDFVWEDLRTIPAETLRHHFPNIVEHCREMGYDVFKECIPVVPAQHYFMGGVKVDYQSRSSMENLYVVGEAACNGVHGKIAWQATPCWKALFSQDVRRRIWQSMILRKLYLRMPVKLLITLLPT